MSSAEISSSFGKPYRPAAIALANRVGRSLWKLGVGGKPITVRGVLSDARRRVGFDDFGDEGFLEPLDVLVDSINREARLNPVGRMIIRGRIVGVLTNKLVAHDTIKRHPEILDIEVESPIVVAGLARTGTTMLHRLIAQDRAIRSLASWRRSIPRPRSRKPGIRKTRALRRPRSLPEGSSTCRRGSSRSIPRSQTHPKKR
ncbi:MAG: sulfotransferase [Deltaproteobacteria bacterium]|nr:sulfotransferase [Deltaproteobacteria bacterium]